MTMRYGRMTIAAAGAVAALVVGLAGPGSARAGTKAPPVKVHLEPVADGVVVGLDAVKA